MMKNVSIFYRTYHHVGTLYKRNPKFYQKNAKCTTKKNLKLLFEISSLNFSIYSEDRDFLAIFSLEKCDEKMAKMSLTLIENNGTGARSAKILRGPTHCRARTRSPTFVLVPFSGPSLLAQQSFSTHRGPQFLFDTRPSIKCSSRPQRTLCLPFAIPKCRLSPSNVPLSQCSSSFRRKCTFHGGIFRKIRPEMEMEVKTSGRVRWDLST